MKKHCIRPLAPDLSGLDLMSSIIGMKAAESITEHYGGAIYKIENASPSELERLQNVGKIRARRIQAALRLGIKAVSEQRKCGAKISGAIDAYKILEPLLRHKPHEVFVVMLLNTRHTVLEIKELFRGGQAMCPVEIKTVFEPAIREGAVSIICAHNHPSGDPRPSPEDIALTERISSAGKILGIRVLDHLIIGDGVYNSMAELGRM